MLDHFEINAHMTWMPIIPVVDIINSFVIFENGQRNDSCNESWNVSISDKYFVGSPTVII